MSFDDYRGLGFPGAADLGSMFRFKHDFEKAFRAARSIDGARALCPQLHDFTAWLDRNRARLV